MLKLKNLNIWYPTVPRSRYWKLTKHIDTVSNWDLVIRGKYPSGIRSQLWLLCTYSSEVGIYKRKQENILSTKKVIKKKRKFFLFFLDGFFAESVFSFFFSCFLDRFLGRVLVFLFSFVNFHLSLSVRERVTYRDAKQLEKRKR